ncbi:MAG: exosome complex protein Rrp42 [Candidatus ainarchaeum sp.]|nr:exosome complex protein Rrp42 [Candidatus ainarchaeum sp.]
MRSTILESDIQKVVSLARDGKRLDNRQLDEMREIKIETGMSENAEGSTIVTLGNTKVIAGLKIEIGTPYPDNQDEGSISIGAENLPLAHPDYESGRPDDDEVEVARVVDRAIRESKAIDFKSLCIIKGEKVWVGYLDFYALNGDGNMFDAGSIAALVTFNNAKMPKLDAENRIIMHEYDGKLKLSRKPLLTTFVKVGGKILLDPTYLEEKAAEARFSVGTTEDGFISAMQKGVGGSFNKEEVSYMIDLAFKNSDKIRKQILKI